MNEVGSLTNKLKDFAEILGWETRVWTEDWSEPNASRILVKQGNAEIRGHLPLRGITLFPHKQCEPVSLTFEPQGCLVDAVGMTLVAKGKCRPEDMWVSTKTQFSPIETHVAIVRLLQHLDRCYMDRLEVHDEGGYWQNGDIGGLVRKFNVINEAMDRLEDGLLCTGSAANGHRWRELM
ncbi:MAG: hypothetical protein WEF53_13240 [Bacteroidota bacterium]